jgi:cell division protein FtsZ
MAVDSPLLETTIKGATDIILNVSGDITLADAADAADYVGELCGEDVNVIFGAMYDEAAKDVCTITVIATGINQNPKPAAQPVNMNSGKVVEPKAQTATQRTQTVFPRTEVSFSSTGTLPPLRKTDLNASMEEKSINIPTFLQRK